MKLIKPEKPYEAFRKLICSMCQSVHTFALNKIQKLPDDIPCGICHQPMKPNHRAERRELRHPVATEALVIQLNGIETKVSILDLSRGGARIAAKCQLSAEPALTLKTTTFHAEGEIVWVTKFGSTSYEAGFAFNEVIREEPYFLIDVRR